MQGSTFRTQVCEGAQGFVGWSRGQSAGERQIENTTALSFPRPGIVGLLFVGLCVPLQSPRADLTTAESAALINI